MRLSQSASAIAVAVAQYAVGLMLLGLWQAPARSAAARAGRPYTGAFSYRDLTGLTVGLIGLSQVGRRVPPLLAPFGCRIVAYDPYWSQKDASALGVTLLPNLDDLLAASDVVSLHAPVTEETVNLLDARRIALLRPGTVFVNTARPQLLDQDALFARARAGEIDACLDVTIPEPLPPTHPAWSLPHLFLTPHIAGTTVQGLRRIAENALGEIERFLAGEPLQSEVTLERYDLLA